MAQTMRIVMVVIMCLVTMECGNGMDTKDHRTCFKTCLGKCRIDDYACQLKCERECPSTPPALLDTSEKEEDHRVCFKNCLEKCRIDDYACQLKCEGLCPFPPPSLSKDEAVMAPEQGDSDVCYGDCSNKWGLDSARMERCLKTCPTSATLF
ncbi:hypothetical protein Bca4012_024071 [Brassica carinata]